MFSKQTESTIKEFEKSQTVRVLDMVVVAPILIYSGAIKSDIPMFLRLSLVGIGIATFVYNGNNFLKNISK